MPQNIALEPVTSSHLAAVGYDPATKTLAVKFAKGGAVYHYFNFKPEDYAELRAAKSIGSHFIHKIQRRADLIPYSRIDAAPEPAKE